jgi:hypothetical protein
MSNLYYILKTEGGRGTNYLSMNASISQVGRRMQTPCEIVLCCIRGMPVLMTSQCLCPVAINKYCQGAEEGFYLQSILIVIFFSFYFVFIPRQHSEVDERCKK